ncbi:MAG: iron-containing redox enzyme family protein [Acidimicrobiia bacterium]
MSLPSDRSSTMGHDRTGDRSVMTHELPPALPTPRGPLSETVIRSLRRATGPIAIPMLDDIDAFTDDAQLALACCYELHYRSFAGVDDRWEWDPGLLTLCRRLEDAFVDRIVDEIGPPRAVPSVVVIPALREIAACGNGPSLSGFMAESGTREHMREFCVHRSAYQRKEADPHTWMIPRLHGRVKAATVTIQHDEYGEGNAAEMHAELFATTMRALDLDPTYGAYLDLLPAPTLATGNLVSLFGLHRRWRGACVGHLALFEMTSVGPMRRYAETLQRFGIGESGRRFYDVHVTADAVHEQIAQEELVAGMLESEPATAGMILFGARALVEVERMFAQHLLHAWTRDTTSLRGSLDQPTQRLVRGAS